MFDEAAQGVAGLAGLPHRFDRILLATPDLPPALPVVPDVAALDLDADDAGALDGDQEVDLVVLEVIGDPLARDHHSVVAELLDQQLVNPPFGGVRQPWRARVDRHRFLPDLCPDASEQHRQSRADLTVSHREPTVGPPIMRPWRDTSSYCVAT